MYALRDIAKPIGVSDYELGQALPSDLRSSLPSIEEIEAELENFLWNWIICVSLQREIDKMMMT